MPSKEDPDLLVLLLVLLLGLGWIPYAGYVAFTVAGWFAVPVTYLQAMALVFLARTMLGGRGSSGKDIPPTEALVRAMLHYLCVAVAAGLVWVTL